MAPGRLSGCQPAGRLLPDRLFVGSCTLGVGSKYPVALRDANGEFLNGVNTYELRLPLTAALLWAVTAYDITDATLVEAATDAIYQQLQQSLYQRRRLDRSMVWTAEAPDAPQSNWIQTVDGRNFLVAFRLYGTGVEFFDQTWKPGDLLRIGSGGRASQ